MTNREKLEAIKAEIAKLESAIEDIEKTGGRVAWDKFTAKIDEIIED